MELSVVESGSTWVSGRLTEGGCVSDCGEEDGWLLCVAGGGADYSVSNCGVCTEPEIAANFITIMTCILTVCYFAFSNKICFSLV